MSFLYQPGSTILWSGVQLSSIPAFGIETIKVNANGFRNTHGNLGTDNGVSKQTYNMTKQAGWIPILGTLFGIIRLKQAINGPLSTVPNRFITFFVEVLNF